MAQRILMLHSSSDLYGASKIFCITATMLRDSGHVVHVVLSEEGLLADQLRQEGLEVSIMRLGVLRRKYFSFGGLLNRGRVIKDAFVELVKMVKDKKINH